MLAGGQHKINIEKTGVSCNVPDNDIARLMYYLNCIDSLIDFGIPANLKDYQNYYKLSFNSENSVICYAHLLDPKTFIRNNIMIIDPSGKLCGNSNNSFFKITDSRFSFAATREFVVGGRNIRTLNIMAYKQVWLDRFYYNPMRHYSERLNAIYNRTIGRFRSNQNTPRNTLVFQSSYTRPSTSNPSNNRNPPSPACSIC